MLIIEAKDIGINVNFNIQTDQKLKIECKKND